MAHGVRRKPNCIVAMMEERDMNEDLRDLDQAEKDDIKRRVQKFIVEEAVKRNKLEAERAQYMGMGATDAKPSNPKDAIGSDKIPLHLWPPSASVLGSLGLLDGMLKYGRSNWRAAGVRYTIYLDAIKRHSDKLLETEDDDPDSGLDHLAHILASAAILVDAKASGMLIDDRQYKGGFFSNFIKSMTPHVKRLKEKYASRPEPKHWTRADNEPIPSGAFDRHSGGVSGAGYNFGPPILHPGSGLPVGPSHRSGQVGGSLAEGGPEKDSQGR